MNFFEAQDKARRNTSMLVILFVFAVAGLILLTNLLILWTLAYSETGLYIQPFNQLQNYFDLDVFVVVSVGVILLIFLGSLYKSMTLSSGGSAVAEMLGGTLIPQSTNDLYERQLINVVEEMAIAAGTPIPKVYLIDESAINAFAAGKSPATAVIGVTRGALKQLTREELQGVIAHEFSHILNGDMKLNIRLISILHGILLIGIIGYYILRSLRYVRSSRNEKSGGAAVAIIALGAGLLIIGYAGTFFGQWIKAVVSRQREYLADSSAVQFTRNKDSIAGALKKIGGLSSASYLDSPAAPEYSHAYFASGVKSFWQSLFATHPPLEKRIKKIDPAWNGKFTTQKLEESVDSSSDESATNSADMKSSVAGMSVTAAVLSAAEQAVTQVGTLNEENIEYAHQLLISLPDDLRNASQSTYSARAVVYALLIQYQTEKQQAWSLLTEHADSQMPELTKKLLLIIKDLDQKYKLLLLELSVNALRELSVNQYDQFRNTVKQIIIADKTVDLNEWVIQRLVLQQLDEQFSKRKPAKARHAYLGAVKKDAETILSLVAYIEHEEDDLALQAFEAGKKEIGANAFNIIARKDLSLNSLNQALDNLMQLKPLLKPRILKAIAAIILYDNETTIKGIEIFRTISTCLDCPMPPLQVKNS